MISWCKIYQLTADAGYQAEWYIVHSWANIFSVHLETGINIIILRDQLLPSRLRSALNFDIWISELESRGRPLFEQFHK